MTLQQLQQNVEQQNKLSEEIAALESKFNSLQSHLNNLKTPPQPVDISVEYLTLDEVIQQSQQAVMRQQEALARQTEAEAIGRSLKIFRTQLAEKRDALRLAKVSSEFERLKHKAVEFNALIDEAVARLDEMKEIGR